MTIKKHYEVVIVGGGPAGSVAAILLARAHFKVLLIEGQKKPHRKVCGEFLCHEGIELLRSINLSQMLDEDWFLPALGAKIVSNTGQSILGLFPQNRSHKPGGFCLNRETFDAHLLYQSKQAGCHVIQGCFVTHLLAYKAGYHVTLSTGEQFDCDLLIGADGIRSTVARQLNLTLSLPEKRFALRCFLPTRQANQRIIELHLLSKGDYIGINVVETQEVNFSIVTSRAELKRHGNSQNLIRFHYNNHPKLQENIILPKIFPKIEAIAPASHRVRSCIAPNLVLIGDAGGFAEPLTGEGITIALWTAIHAAQQLIRCKANKHWDRRNDYLKAYIREKHRHYFQKSCFAKLLHKVITQEKLCDHLATYFNANPKLIHGFMGVINNTDTPLEAIFKMFRQGAFGPVPNTLRIEIDNIQTEALISGPVG